MMNTIKLLSNEARKKSPRNGTGKTRREPNISITKLIMTFVFAALLAGCGGGGSKGGGGSIVIPPSNDTINRAPIISSLSPEGTASDPVKIEKKGAQHLVVAAHDPDNDPLTYKWIVDSGSIVGSTPEADFTAPNIDSNSIVTVQVSDNHDHTVSATCYFKVGEGSTRPPTNDPPEIASMVANPSSVDVNGKSTITAIVTDPDGDELTYSWTCSGGGIESENGDSAVWKAPSVASGCSVTLSVSDGQNPAVTKSVPISVAGQVQPPVFSGLTATYLQNDGISAHPDLSKGNLVFERVDPTINFDWGRKAPDPRLITIPETGNGHDFGVVWEGYIKCQEPGNYSFRARYDDGFRLRISNDNNQMQTVIDGWIGGPARAEFGTISLKGGKWYKIEAQYFEDEDRSYIQLFWMSPGATSWQVIPGDALHT